MRYHDLNKRSTVINQEVEENADSTLQLQSPDSTRVRSNPYAIREEQAADERTINIVRDKPLRVNRRRR